MSKPVWSKTQPSNISLGTFVERKPLGLNNVPIIELLVSGNYSNEDTSNNVTVSLISGQLPGGLRLSELNILGTPFSVLGSITSRFVLRAKNTYLDQDGNEQVGISDRTFTITISSEKESIQWTTPEGLLPVGANKHYYILDNSWIDFQLDAIDEDVPSDKYLNYHIPPYGGELPGGITLSKTGRLSGFTAPLIDAETGYLGSGYSSGNFDVNFYDKFAYDYGVRPTNGYDTFYFDNTTYDYFTANRAPKKLNRHYSFIVRASNKSRYVDRKFQIYVVGDDYMRTDNDILRVGTNTYSADNTYMRRPIWITKNYLGRLRANNYITIILDVFDPTTIEGHLGYVLASNNNEVITKGSWNNGDHVELTKASQWTDSTIAQGSISNIYFDDVTRKWKADIVLSVGYTTGLGVGSILTAVNDTGQIMPDTRVLSVDPEDKRFFTITSLDEPSPGLVTRITSNSISVDSTMNLKVGMNVYITNGIGKFAPGTKINDISEKGNTFTVSIEPITRLYNANVYAVTPKATLELLPVDTTSIIGNLQKGLHVECTVSPIFLFDVFNTDSVTGYLTCGSTDNLKVSASIVFSGATFGNIIPNVVYYVSNIVNSENFTISKTLNGPVNPLTTGSGLMSVSYPSSLVPQETVVTGWNYSGEFSGKGIYKKGEIVKYKDQLYKVTSQTPITNISPLNENYFQPTKTFTMDISWDSPNDLYNTNLALLRIGSDSVLPPGMELDSLSGEVYGSVPSQAAITQNYKFTVIAIRYANATIGYTGSVASGYIAYDFSNPNVFSYRTFNVDIIGEIDSVIYFTTDGDLKTIDANFISNLSVNAITTIPNAVLTYNIKSGKLPPGLILVNDGTIQGKVNQFSDGIYYRSMWKPNRSYVVNDVVKITSTEDIIGKYYKCIISHSSSVFNSSKWTIYIDDFTKDGLITFDKNLFSCDGFTTSFDKTYTFTVEAKDQFNQSATTKTFKLSISTPTNKSYSNIYIKPLLKLSMRDALTAFFNDTSIFEPAWIYRSSDPNFGIQNELKMLLYAGIESNIISAYISAFGRSSRKKFRIGNLKKATAKAVGTNNIVYELIYLEILDNLENEIGSVSESIKTVLLNHPINVNQGRRDIVDGDASDVNISTMSIDQLSGIYLQDKVITVDFGGQRISDINKSDIFGNSVTNIRKKIEMLGETERNYLPLWMRTPQTFSGIAQGFTKAVPICYCIPGTADNIMLNIKNSRFDFKMIDYTIDRAIIDSVIGDAGDKYIAFAAREVING
jgi:hypothetical protein